MTIAACYVTNEGVVMGADSAVTQGPNVLQFNYTQKLFEVGEDGCFGIVFWGLGGFPQVSFRTLVARLADAFRSKQPTTVKEAADRWAALAWPEYRQMFSQSPYADLVKEQADLKALKPRKPEQDARLNELTVTLEELHTLGWCIGGRCEPDRIPTAFGSLFRFVDKAPPPPEQLKVGNTYFWGVPVFSNRLIYGIDEGLLMDILKGGWGKSEQDLKDLIANYIVRVPTNLPLRDAVDWLHAAIYTTIKAIKFSQAPRVCGGPIEIALITSDRKFRWVRHKRMDQAIADSLDQESWL